MQARVYIENLYIISNCNNSTSVTFVKLHVGCFEECSTFYTYFKTEHKEQPTKTMKLT